MTEEEKRGFNYAVDRIIEILSEQANNHAKIATELKEKHRESRPHKYKALALLDFKIYLESLFKTNVTIGDINES